MRYLVTGATGALGGAVVRALSRQGETVRAFVHHEEADEPFDVGRPDVEPEVVVGDPLVPADVRPAVADCDVVVHCLSYPLSEYELHLDAVRVLVSSGRSAAPQVVYPGTALVFGEPDRLPITPETPFDPPSRAAEIEVRVDETLAESDFPTTVVHLPTGYGPLVDNVLSRRVFEPALAGRDARFPGPVDVPHEFVYVDDAARALAAVAGNEVAEGERYTVGATRPTTVRKLGELVYETAGTRGEVRGRPGWLLDVLGLVSAEVRESTQAMDVFEHDLRLDGSAIREDVGFAPRVDYEEGVERWVTWHRSRPELAVES